MPLRSRTRDSRCCGRGLTALAAAVAASVVGATAIRAQALARSWRDRVDGIVHDTTFANGLTVIVGELHAVPIATVEVVVRTGAFTQEPGDEGISHLYEHILFRSYGADAQFAIDVADLMGTYNGSTSEEMVSYHVTAPSGGVPAAVRMMARLVMAARFRNGDIQAERDIVVNEFERDASQSDFVLRDAMGHRLWGADWPRKDALGTEASIDTISDARLKQVYDRYYVPGNSAVVVTGDVRAAVVFADIAKRFGGWKAGADPHAKWPEPPPHDLSAPATFVVSAPHQRLVTLQIAWQGPSVRGAPAAANAADVFAAMMNSEISPLVDRIVNARLAQSASMSYSPLDRRGPVVLTFDILPAAAERAIPAIRAELDHLDSPQYVNDSLLYAARRQRDVDAEFELAAGSGLAHSLGYWWSVADLNHYRTRLDAQAKLTVDDIRRYVRDVLLSSPYVVGALTAPVDTARVRVVVESAFPGTRLGTSRP